MKTKLSRLIFKSFVTSHGWQKLTNIIRYLNALEARLENLVVLLPSVIRS
ncbi:MAG: DUF3418 domain-containing protein [Arsenophonus sp. NEOnobi-MAG3]